MDAVLEIKNANTVERRRCSLQLRPGRFPLDQQEKKSSMALSGHKREREGGDYNDAASGSGARSYAGPMPSGSHLGMLDLVMIAF